MEETLAGVRRRTNLNWSELVEKWGRPDTRHDEALGLLRALPYVVGITTWKMRMLDGAPTIRDATWSEVVNLLTQAGKETTTDGVQEIFIVRKKARELLTRYILPQLAELLDNQHLGGLHWATLDTDIQQATLTCLRFYAESPSHFVAENDETQKNSRKFFWTCICCEEFPERDLIQRACLLSGFGKMIAHGCPSICMVPLLYRLITIEVRKVFEGPIDHALEWGGWACVPSTLRTGPDLLWSRDWPITLEKEDRWLVKELRRRSVQQMIERDMVRIRLACGLFPRWNKPPKVLNPAHLLTWSAIFEVFRQAIIAKRKPNNALKAAS
jgi:hypothetical protein